MAHIVGRDFGRGDDLASGLSRRSRKRRGTLGTLAQTEPLGSSRRNDLLIDCRLENRPLNSLKRPPRNVRRVSEAQIARVTRSMSELGAASPAIITSDAEIVDGVTRIEAARRLGLAAYPCYVLPPTYTDGEVRLLRATLNRTQELGEWSLPELKVELEDLRLIGAQLDITGFTMPEIDQICLDQPQGGPEAEELTPDEAQFVVSKADDLWLVGEHRVICGDARNRAIYDRLCDGDPPARLCLTDVPYNLRVAGLVTSGGHGDFAMASGEMTTEEFAAFNIAWMSQVARHLIDGGLLATFIDWRSVELVLGVGRGEGLHLLNLIVWAKTNAGQGSLWRSQHELMPVFKKGDAPHCNNVELGRHGRWRSNLWSYPGASSLGSDAREGLKFHPTVKPVALLEDALLDVSNLDDIVLEPFLGSGSLLIAAEKTGRIARAVEIAPAYVDVSLRRWMKLTGKLVTLADTGETFEDVSARRGQHPTAAYGLRTPKDGDSVKPRIRVKAASVGGA